MTFIAQYDGACAAECGYRIHPGDAVKYVEDDLVHAECAPKPDPFELRPSEVVCPDCFLVRPCRCVE